MKIRCGDLANEPFLHTVLFLCLSIKDRQLIFMIAEIEKRPERMRSPDTKYPFFTGIGELSPTSIFAQVAPGHCLPDCDFDNFCFRYEKECNKYKCYFYIR